MISDGYSLEDFYHRYVTHPKNCPACRIFVKDRMISIRKKFILGHYIIIPVFNLEPHKIEHRKQSHRAVGTRSRR